MTPEETVDAFFLAAFTGDRETALSLAADGAEHHGDLDADHAFGGTRPIAEYVDLIFDWARTHPEYRFDRVDRKTIGDELVVTHLKSTGGDDPDPAEGLMVMRVRDGKLLRVFAIPATGRGRYGF
ncbi:MAG TPA: nuclear transport factor 2 family protein [Acidimicrobiales bacterium]|nr:nuclear transport factor 2 family protein [Acidimicrobiales bacterium]